MKSELAESKTLQQIRMEISEPQVLIKINQWPPKNLKNIKKLWEV